MKVGRVPGHKCVTASLNSDPIIGVKELASLILAKSSFNRPCNCEFVRLVQFAVNVSARIGE